MYYLVCNIQLINQLRNIAGFKLDLGLKKLNDQQQYFPTDAVVYTHIKQYNQHIDKIGNIGTLCVYTESSVPYNYIYFYNIKDNNTNKYEHPINSTISLYDNINEGLNNISELNTSEKEVENKPIDFSTLSLEERIAIARRK